MFENLTEKLQRTFKNLRGQGKLTEEHLGVALGEIRGGDVRDTPEKGILTGQEVFERVKKLKSETPVKFRWLQ